MALKTNTKGALKRLVVPMVPWEEFWTEERIERRLRELGPVKGEREFLKFMREAMARQAAAKANEEKAAKGER